MYWLDDCILKSATTSSDLAKCQYRSRHKEMKLEVAKVAKYSFREKECELKIIVDVANVA